MNCAEDTDSWKERVVDTRGRKQRILVVDDEPAIRDLLHQVLSADGHTVDQPQDSHDALDMMRRHRYDCIIMDLRMPDISGQQLYRIVADTDPELARKVIFVTGDTVRRETREFLEATGNTVFSKPINMIELRQQIQELAETVEQVAGP
jgi:CheY-like chemotaxis protein